MENRLVDARDQGEDGGGREVGAATEVQQEGF